MGYSKNDLNSDIAPKYDYPYRMGAKERAAHPKGRDWTEEERDYAIMALMAAEGNVKLAYEKLKVMAKEIDGIYCPDDYQTARHSLAALKHHNRALIVNKIVSDKVLWKFYNLLENGGEKTQVEVGKYFWDRDEGKPVARMEVDANVRTHEDAKREFEENRSKYSSGTWYNAGSGDGIEDND